MGHGPYDIVRQHCTTHDPWGLDHRTPHDTWKISCPWVMGRTTVPLPVNHGLYDSISTPCIMGRTTVYFPMDHGLYDNIQSTHSPCIMGRTTHWGQGVTYPVGTL